DPVAADTLAARASRAGLSYVTEVTMASDSVVFTRAMRAGAGTVIGPIVHEDAWSVARVLEVLPGRPARFEELGEAIEQRGIAEDGELRLQELWSRLRRGTRIEIDSHAVADLCATAGTRSPADVPR